MAPHRIHCPLHAPAVLLFALLAAPAGAQNLAALLEKLELVEQFDADRDGRLDRSERDRARAWIDEHRPERNLSNQVAPPSDRQPLRFAPADVESYPGRDLYDPEVVRTLFLDFEAADWEHELASFWGTDIEVPATLTVDGATYPDVGVRFRGSSSYLLAVRSRKKSFNVSLDAVHDKQRLLGYRTLNLLNGHGDASMLREVLFHHIARSYIPTLRSNFVRVVINGENWGVYGNSQQFNTDFIVDAFGSKEGVRWKVLRNEHGAGAMLDLGDDPADYTAFELKTGGDPAAWDRLIRCCKKLHHATPAELESDLPEILDVDGTLWFLALENVFMDTDGYVRQGYDYRLFEDAQGRFHPLLYDANEALPPLPANERAATAAERRGQILLNTSTSPLAQADNEERPLVHRLLAVPAWRARYLAHVRTIVDDWLDWESIGALAESYHRLIDAHVAADDKRASTYEAFRQSLTEDQTTRRGTVRSLRTVVSERREYLLAHEAMAGPWPEIAEVSEQGTGQQAESRTLRIRAQTVEGPDALRPASVWLHYCVTPGTPYRQVPMPALGDGHYECTLTGLTASNAVRYYVEARGPEGSGRTAFCPSAAEARPREYRFEQ